jgi:hypothetical protein
MHALLPFMLLALAASPAQAPNQAPPTRIVSIGQGSVMTMPEGARQAAV